MAEDNHGGQVTNNTDHVIHVGYDNPDGSIDWVPLGPGQQTQTASSDPTSGRHDIDGFWDPESDDGVIKVPNGNNGVVDNDGYEMDLTWYMWAWSGLGDMVYVVGGYVSGQDNAGPADADFLNPGTSNPDDVPPGWTQDANGDWNPPSDD